MLLSHGYGTSLICFLTINNKIEMIGGKKNFIWPKMAQNNHKICLNFFIIYNLFIE